MKQRQPRTWKLGPRLALFIELTFPVSLIPKSLG